MTKEQIKKALECCTTYEPNVCKKCPYLSVGDCSDAMIEGARSLITEQEKEIDLLQMQMKDVVNHADTFLAEANKFETENKKLKAEIEQRKIDYDILYKKSTKRLKQAKIDVLNKLKEKAISLSAIETYHICNLVDEMIEELKK